jgi:hypothetical protein
MCETHLHLYFLLNSLQEGVCDPLASITPERMSQYLSSASFANLDGEITAFDDSAELASVKYIINNVQLDGVFVRMKNVSTIHEKLLLHLNP